MKLTFNVRYLLLTLLLLCVEIVIALYIRDTIIRPFIGDVLVVILIYCFFNIFLTFPKWQIALGVLIFACLIEIGQYFDYVKLLGVENIRILSVMMGRTFELSDFGAYFTGFAVIVLVENLIRRKAD